MPQKERKIKKQTNKQEILSFIRQDTCMLYKILKIVF